MDGPSLLDPVRVVVPKGHVYYGPLLVVRAKSYLDPETSWSYSRVDGLWASVGFCIFFLALRWTWNYSFSVLLRRRARCDGRGAQVGPAGSGRASAGTPAGQPAAAAPAAARATGVGAAPGARAAERPATCCPILNNAAVACPSLLTPAARAR
jgi:hypothetical protein